MTKEILLSLKGLQIENSEQADEMETITPADYYMRNGSHYVVYDEVMEGFEETTRNMFKFRDSYLEVSKKGLINVHMVFEENKKNMTNYRTPYGTLLIGLDTSKVSLSEKEEEIKLLVGKTAKLVGLTDAELGKSPFDLSGGQKRRAAIAGVMAMEPDVLVLDEPAAGLDPEGRESIFSAIEAYRRQKNATVIIVSHSMEDMAKWCDNIVVMAHSDIIMSGTRDEVFSRASELADVGLDIPHITRLMMLLRERGIEIDEKIYTVEAATAALHKLFDTKAN